MSRLAEQKIIGCLMLDSQYSFGKIYGIVEPEMFTDDLLRNIYIEYLRAYERNNTINEALIAQDLQNDNLDSSTIFEVLVNCAGSTTTSIEVVASAKVVVNDYKARELNAILNRIKVSPKGIDEQIGAIANELDALQNNRDSNTHTLAEIAEQYKDDYFKKSAQENKVFLGFYLVDEILGGLEGGDTIVLGARPAVGKSAFVTQITMQLSKQGKRVGFYNLEMKEKQLYERFVTSLSGIPLSRIKSATSIVPSEEKPFKQANEELTSNKNIVITTGRKSAKEIMHECRHMNYDVVIIDYLQLIKVDDRYRGTRYAEVGEVSRLLKEMAMELNIPVIILSQLNRASETRETKKPTLADLRESGDIEQDASVIMFLWNCNPEDRRQKGWACEKNRQGRLGEVAFEFDGEHMQFRESNNSIESMQGWNNADEPTPFD